MLSTQARTRAARVNARRASRSGPRVLHEQRPDIADARTSSSLTAPSATKSARIAQLGAVRRERGPRPYPDARLSRRTPDSDARHPRPGTQGAGRRDWMGALDQDPPRPAGELLGSLGAERQPPARLRGGRHASTHLGASATARTPPAPEPNRLRTTEIDGFVSSAGWPTDGGLNRT
jgi:hypothetical protein